MPDPTHEQIFSASSINTFMRCARQWEYAYVYEYKRPPSVRQLIGTSAHSAVEINYAQKIESHKDLPEDDVVDAFVTAFDAGKVETEVGEESPEKGRVSGINTVSKYQRVVAPEVQPLWVEREVQYRLNGIAYGGTIDLVDDREVVRDLKTVARKPQSGDSYLTAMAGYALGYRQETGKTEAGITLDFMVRTKDPYYYPVELPPTTDKAISAFAGIVGLVAKAVEAGIFLPTGINNHACSWCGYRDICDAVNT